MRILHTMLRVGNLERSLKFYTEVLGMRLLRTIDRPDQKYALAFVGYEDEEQSAVLELTYNYGVDKYELGTAYGHVAIGVPDVFQTCEDIKRRGGKVTREAGPVKGGATVIAFLEDPDGYKIELIESGPSSAARVCTEARRSDGALIRGPAHLHLATTGADYQRYGSRTMKIYAFDVDDTLEVSAGPISIVSVGSLRAQGHIVGLNGNWAAVVQTVPVWHRIFSFIGPMEMSKAIFLDRLKTYIRADDYIMVGNIKGVSGASDDEGAANLAGWRFIKESDFAAGTR